MATYNFYVRKRYYYPEAGGSPTTQHKFWESTINGSNNTILKCANQFNVSTRIYVLAPFVYSGSNNEFEPTTQLTTTLQSLSLVTDRGFGGSPSHLYFGDLNFNEANTLALCTNIVTGSSPYTNYITLSNSKWESNNWTPSVYDTFLDEVTTHLATRIENNFSDTWNTRDWNLIMFMNQIDGNTHIPIFYQGNDPNADDEIEVVV